MNESGLRTNERVEPPQTLNPSGIESSEPPVPKKRRRRRAANPPAAQAPFCATAADHEANMRALGQTPGQNPGQLPTFGQQIGGWIDSLGPGGGATLPDGLKYALGTMAGMALTAALARSRKK